jgi:hypothetical protein
MKQLRIARGGDRTSEQKKNTSSPNPEDVAAILASSIDNVVTLPKAVYKGNDALKICEELKKGENQSQ